MAENDCCYTHIYIAISTVHCTVNGIMLCRKDRVLEDSALYRLGTVSDGGLGPVSEAELYWQIWPPASPAECSCGSLDPSTCENKRNLCWLHAVFTRRLNKNYYSHRQLWPTKINVRSCRIQVFLILFICLIRNVHNLRLKEAYKKIFFQQQADQENTFFFTILFWIFLFVIYYPNLIYLNNNISS